MRDQDCGAITGCAAPKCQLNGQCSTVPVDGGIICRPSQGVCDVEERCSGTSTQCPVNLLRTTVCSPAAMPCEGDAVCDGLRPACPTNPLRDAGTVCLSPACLPPITCSGASSFCTGPVDAGQLCDDRNPCSIDTCAGGASCSYSLEPSITSRALLNTFADAGVIRLALPRSTTTLTTPGGNLSLTLCPNDAQVTATPPECIVEVRLSGTTFVPTRTATQFTATGPASMRLQVLPWAVTGVSSGAGGSYMGVGGCSGPLPANVQPVNVTVGYGFRIDEGDGGLLTLLPFTNIETEVGMQVTTCQYLGFPTALFPTFSNAVRGLVAGSIRAAVDQAFTASMMEQLCLRPGDAGVCQYGTPSNGLCMSGMSCFSARHFRAAVPTIPACVR